MQTTRYRSAVAIVALLAAVACTADGPVGPSGFDAPSLDVIPDPGRTIHIALCKTGLDEGTIGQSFDFTVEATGGQVLTPALSVVAAPIQDEIVNCALVWGHPDVSYDSDTEVTITELPASGYTLESAGYWIGETFVQLPITDGSVTLTPEGGQKYVVFRNKEEGSPALGRMTGGGHQIRVDGAKVTRGLTLHCDITLSNNLEINWPGGNKWHLEKESLEAVECIDDPAYDPFPPVAPFDTFIARAIGALNGVDGSIIDFKFIDDGEPGRTDEAHFTIYEANQGPGQVAPGSEVIALQVSGQLDGGNLQAHYDQPHS